MRPKRILDVRHRSIPPLFFFIFSILRGQNRNSSPVSRSIVKAQKYREIGTPEFFVLSGSWYDLVRSKKIPDLHISEIAFICRHFMI